MTIDPKHLEEYNAFRRSQGQPPLPASAAKRAHLVHLSDGAWEGLQALAARLKYAHHTGGNVTALLEALGNGLLTCEYDDTAS